MADAAYCGTSLAPHLQKFNVCGFVASTQAFVAEAGIALVPIYREALNTVVRLTNTCRETSLLANVLAIDVMYVYI